MLSRQLTFWDNEAIEKGLHCLSALALEEALLLFNKALQAGIGEADFIKQLIDACEYWLPRIQYTPTDATNQPEQINALLSAYTHYPFNRQIEPLKKALLVHIAGLFFNEAGIDLNVMEIAFDLLIESGDIERAEGLVSYSTSRLGEKPLLLYMLAQTQWQNGDRSKANNNYIKLLLHHPDRVEFNRIENKKLQELINLHGTAMAPAYGWLQNIVPVIHLPDEIEIYDEDHRKAIECYRLLLGANKAIMNNDKKLSVQLRKQLKALAPDLFAAYFSWLQQQE